jgi:hypothetical protein
LAVALALAASTSAAADQVVILQRPTLGHLLVDNAHGHVFISGGYRQNDGTVDVYGFDGVREGGLSVPGADGLAIGGSTLYVAGCGTTSIEAFDLATLAHTGTITVSHIMDYPCDLAVAGGKLWFDATISGQSHTSPGSVTTAAPHTESEPASLSALQAPTFATSSAHPNMLVVSDTADTPGDVDVIDASGAVPAVTATGSGLAGVLTAAGAAITPDGNDVLLAANGNEIRAYRASDMATVDTTYPTGAYPGGVTISPDGAYVAVTGYFGGVEVFPTGTATPLLQDMTDPDGYNWGQFLDLAFTSDDSALFTITGLSANSSRLSIIDHPTLPGTSIALNVNASPAVAGSAATVSGTLTTQAGAPLAGKTVTVRAAGPDGNGWSVIGSPITAADGSFTVKTTDTLEAGEWAFGATYAGSATLHGTALTKLVSLAADASTLTLTATPVDPVPNQPVTLSGTLTLSVGGSPVGDQIQVWETLPGGAKQPLATPVADEEGNFSVSLPAGLPAGTTIFDARFAGDDAHTFSTASVSVSAGLKLTSLSIKAPRSITYGRSANLKIHLGPHETRSVSIWATPRGASRRLIETGTVDRTGDLTVAVHPKKDTLYTVGYAGDDTYQAITRSHTVKVHAIVRAAMIRWYARSGAYHLYRYTSTCVHRGRGCPEIQASVIPNKRTEYVTFVLQSFRRGHWAAITSARFRLNRRSSVTALIHYVNSGSIGHRQRVRAIYEGDGAIEGNQSKWQYFEVTG